MSCSVAEPANLNIMTLLHRRFLPDFLDRRRALALGASAGRFDAAAIRCRAAVTRLDVTQGNFQPMPIAIPIFSAARRAITKPRSASRRSSPQPQAQRPVRADRSGRLIEKIASVDAVPRFPDWRTINAQALVTGRITRQPDGRLKAEFRLWDVLAGQQLPASNISPRPTIGAASRTSSRMRSTSG
jgi:TolB protein